MKLNQVRLPATDRVRESLDALGCLDGCASGMPSNMRALTRVYWHTDETDQTSMALYDTLADKPGFVMYRYRQTLPSVG